jgi:hypothetical protein
LPTTTPSRSLVTPFGTGIGGVVREFAFVIVIMLDRAVLTGIGLRA